MEVIIIVDKRQVGTALKAAKEVIGDVWLQSDPFDNSRVAICTSGLYGGQHPDERYMGRTGDLIGSARCAVEDALSR